MKAPFKGFLMAMGMYCIIPLPFKTWDERYKSMVLTTFPIVGFIIGGLWCAVGALLSAVEIESMLAAAFLTLFPFVMSGFIHLDGYMDTSDAILSRRGTEEKRRVLKDPHTGAFAVIMLAALFMLMFSGIYTIFPDAGRLMMLWPICVLSRCGSAICLFWLKPISQSGYGYLFGKAARRRHWIFVFIVGIAAIAAAWLILKIAGLVTIGAVIIGYGLSMRCAYRSLEGVSGDLAGFSMVISEIFGIMALAIV